MPRLSATPLAIKFETLRSTTAKQLNRQERMTEQVAKNTTIAILRDRNKSWMENLMRTERLERRIDDLEAALERLVRHVARLDKQGGDR